MPVLRTATTPGNPSTFLSCHDKSVLVLLRGHGARAVKSGSRAGELPQHRSWRKTRAEGVSVALQAANEFGCAQRVGIVERTAQERWKAETEDRADVAIPRRSQDPFAEAMHGFVDHPQGAALRDFQLR